MEISQTINSDGTPSKDANPLIRRFDGQIKDSGNKWARDLKQIRENRKFVANRGKQSTVKDYHTGPNESAEADPDKLQRANIVYATIQGLIPYIYAKNPNIGARPSENTDAGTTSYMIAGQFAQTLELVVNQQLRHAGLKKAAKQCIREAMISRVGMVKVGYQTDFYQDPIMKSKLSDKQEALALIRADAEKLERSDDDDEINAQVELLQNEIAALEKDVDVIRSQGLVIDPFSVDDFRMDTNIDTLYQYTEASWMAHRVWMTEDAIDQRFDVDEKELERLTRYTRNEEGIATVRQGDGRNSASTTSPEEMDQSVIPVWEYWDKTSRTVYTWAEGGHSWLRAAYQPDTMGERWYPFFLLGFNWLDSLQEWPTSDVEMLSALGDEYNRIRDQGYHHRTLSVPSWVFDKSIVNPDDIKAYAAGKAGEFIGINAGGGNLQEHIQESRAPSYNPNIYDTTQIRTDIEWISGLGDAQRGGVLKAKTATEAQIQQGGLNTRVEEKRDISEDFIEEISRYAGEMLIQVMPLEEVRRIAGPNAFWPPLDKNTLFSLVEIEIEAGSTSKPNKAEELSAWSEIMPLILQTVGVIMQMRATGVPDDENPYVQILQETLRRVDERISLEKFLPGQPVQEQPPMMGMGMPGQQPMAGPQPMPQQQPAPGMGMPPAGPQGMPPMMPQQAPEYIN